MKNIFKKKYIYILLAFLITGFSYSCKDEEIDEKEKEEIECPDDEDGSSYEKSMYYLLVNNLFDIDTLSVPGDTIYSVKYGKQKNALPPVYTKYFDSDTSAYLWFYYTFYAGTFFDNDEVSSDFAITPKTIDLGEYGTISYKPMNDGFTLGEVSVNLKGIDVLTKYELLSVNAIQENQAGLCTEGNVYVDTTTNIVYLCVRSTSGGCDGLLITGYGNGTGHTLREQKRNRDRTLINTLESDFKKFFSNLNPKTDYVSFEGCPSYDTWNAFADMIDGKDDLENFKLFLSYISDHHNGSESIVPLCNFLNDRLKIYQCGTPYEKKYWSWFSYKWEYSCNVVKSGINFNQNLNRWQANPCYKIDFDGDDPANCPTKSVGREKVIRTVNDMEGLTYLTSYEDYKEEILPGILDSLKKLPPIK